MNQTRKRKYYFILCLVLAIGFSFVTPVCSTPLQTEVQAASVKLSKKKITLHVGDTYTLKVKNTGKKVKWSSGKKSVATVNAKGKVTAKKSGTAVITAKVGAKRFKCTVTVKESETDQMIALVNKERKADGKAALKKNHYLMAAAKIRAKELTRVFSHTRPDGSSCFTAVSPSYRYRMLGENIAYGYPTPAAVTNGWMHSPGHRANILNSSYTEIGVAVYQKDGAKYWVQIFGRSN